MGIENAGKLPVYDDIDENLRKLLTQIILNQDEGIDGDSEEHPVQKLIQYAQKEKDRLE